MTISRLEARRLLPYLRELPHEKEGLYGLTNAAFKNVGIHECQFIGSSLDCGTGYAVVGGEKVWAQIVSKKEMETFCGTDKAREL